MDKTFSTKLDATLLRRLEVLCKKYHLKKSHILAEIIAEGIERKMQAMELAQSIQRGLAQENRGEFYTADEIEARVFGKKKAA